MSELAQRIGFPSRLPPVLRITLRELQGGLHGFYVFIACIALGVMTIASVGSFARGLTEGLAREGRVILGGDVSFSLIQRAASADERAFVTSRGAVTATATLRAMARTTGPDANTALVEIKAVDGAYPLYGAVVTEPAGDLGHLLAKRGETFGAVVDPALLTRLNLRVGDRMDVGEAQFDIRATLAAEPDKLAGGIAFGPRLLISQDALACDRPHSAGQPRTLALPSSAPRQ